VLKSELLAAEFDAEVDVDSEVELDDLLPQLLRSLKLLFFFFEDWLDSVLHGTCGSKVVVFLTSLNNQ
jgi:hypothetical protein